MEVDTGLYPIPGILSKELYVKSDRIPNADKLDEIKYKITISTSPQQPHEMIQKDHVYDEEVEIICRFIIIFSMKKGIELCKKENCDQDYYIIW